MLINYFLMAGFLLSNEAIAQDTVVLKTTTQLFGPGTISAGEFELNTSFASDNKTVFFTKATTNWEMLAICASTRRNKKWNEPVLLPFSGKYRDADPFVSSDGTKLYFISDRPIGEAPFKNFDYHIFYVLLKKGRVISEPQLLTLDLPAGMQPLYPSLAANNNLYFTANVNGKSALYWCEWKDGRYRKPQTLSFYSEAFQDLDPVVAFDESFIIFSSNNRKGLGGSDLYISFQVNGTWTTPVNMGTQINSRGVEMAPGLSRDNKKLYFTAYREKFDRLEIKEGSSRYRQLKSKMQSYKNGIGNIYEIDISEILDRVDK